jgi:hypothetical protein
MERGFLQSLGATASGAFVAVAAGAILGYGVVTTLFQYWIVSLVEERVRLRDRPGVALVNLALMPAGQALLLAVFFEVTGNSLTRPHASPSLTTGLSRIFPLWVTALSGFFFGGLLLAVLPRVGKHFREPEVSIFCGGLFVAVAYNHPGLTSGLCAMWVFGRHHLLMAVGLLALAKGVSLGCRYVITLLMARAREDQRLRKESPRLPLALAFGTSSTLMLVPLLALLHFLNVRPPMTG